MQALRQLALITAAIVAVVAVTACSSDKPSNPKAVEGQWTLAAFGGSEALTPADPNVTSEITLSDGKAEGNGGVNSFSGTHEVSGENGLRFGTINATKMAGSPEADAQEVKFFEALENTRRFTREDGKDGKLILESNNNDTLAVLMPR